MSTRTIMLARIADEIDRTDLTSQIANAVDTAITLHEGQRFWFNEVGGVSFVTVANTAYYSEPADLLELDAIRISYSGKTPPLKEKTWEWYRDHALDSSSGVPWAFAQYEAKTWLFPTPNAVYTLYRDYLKKFSTTLVADTNAWYVEAEALIRAEAKRYLNVHVLRNQTEAAMMEREVSRALANLQRQTIMRTSSGQVRACYL